MSDLTPLPPLRAVARLVAQRTVSASGLQRLELELPRPVAWAPGQFAMLNPVSPHERVFARPLSLLAADGALVSVLYRVVGAGTAGLASARVGDQVAWLGPLGRPFPAPTAGEHTILLAGGVGLPPLLAWLELHGRAGDLACFGARHPDDVPWALLGSSWRVAVEEAGPLPAGRTARTGTVIGLARALLAAGPLPAAASGRVLACGPRPLLRAAADLATAHGWSCLVSVEERMGCGYGVCRGCVVPGRDGNWLAACTDGPVLSAECIDWDLFGRPDASCGGAASSAGGCGGGSAEQVGP